MRPKVVFFFMLVAVAIVLVAGLYKKHSSAPERINDVPTNDTTAPASAPAVAATAAANVAAANVSAPIIARKPATPAEREAMIKRETDRLAVLAMANDRQSLSNIVGSLTSPEKEIRFAAIEAVKQFGSADAIPVLQGMAANAADPEEAQALSDAAEFLALPDVNLVSTNSAPVVPEPSAPATNQDNPPLQP